MIATLILATSFSSAQNIRKEMEKNIQLIPFEVLESSPWRVRHWVRNQFIFLSYGGDWSRGNQRAAHECRAQSLLTPTWEDSTFTHPVESSATEWGWTLKPEGENRRECYEWVKQVYLERIKRHAHSNAPMKEGLLFYSLTGHSWFSGYGAQWGCDMIGLETGENIIAMQAQIAFLRGAARQNSKPFYVQPSQWYSGTVPIYEEGEDEYTPHQLNEDEIRAAIAKGGIAIPNGGHSPSLLSRMWYVAWLSGAGVLCPEACQDNFFTGRSTENWQKPKDERIPLSPIGKRAKDFMLLVKKHPDIGIPYTPFAIMLDKYCGFNGFPLTQPRPWNVLLPSLPDREISLFLDIIFSKSMYLDFIPGVDIEQADRRLVKSPYGDSFDVLLSNVSLEVLKSYPVVICLGEHEFLPETVENLILYLESGGKLFLTYAQAAQLSVKFQTLKKAGDVTLFGLDEKHLPDNIDTSRWYTPAHWGADEATLAARKKAVELLPYEVYFKESVSQVMSDLYEQYMPVSVSGEIEFTVNRREGSWVIGLINNEGVTKGNMSPVELDTSKKQTVNIFLKHGITKSTKEWCLEQELEMDQNSVTVEVPPGEVRIVELYLSGRLK